MTSIRRRAAWLVGVAVLGLAFSSGTAYAAPFTVAPDPDNPNVTVVTLELRDTPAVQRKLGTIGPITRGSQELVAKTDIAVNVPATQTLKVVLNLETPEPTSVASSSSTRDPACSERINEVSSVVLNVGAEGSLVLTGTVQAAGQTPVAVNTINVPLPTELGAEPIVVPFTLCF